MGEQSGDGASLHERMERYESLAAEELRYRERKSDVLEDVSAALAETIESATEECRVTVEATETSADGRQHRLRARLDTADLVARITETLPDGFILKHLHDDGTVSIAWDERATVPDERHYSAILKAIVEEETETEDGLIVDVPREERVRSRAVDLGVPEDLAVRRLSHLDDIGVLSVADGRVYPGTNYSSL
ncbi:hypothetical protein VB773_04255 [Haloarculaceae archaeon H-GB2-1]|nr:hypothetical protein [Haloarculaceae archaeon H-GB1-1]MEA5388811.1 hypothetical protein [Haloarculaceae archaeon H-GB11]MEA5406868.1 hypothetical protein [Haloarculaceae archaeon H-GB2-1]